MRSHQLTVGEVFTVGLPRISNQLSGDKLYAANAIVRCRTAALGAHLMECTSCGQRRAGYNSCWKRICATCQGSVAAAWVESRSEELLPVKYFHTVFTFPAELRELCYQNKRVVYELFFQCVAETLQTVASNVDFLGASIGFTMILHTWDQQMRYHPHLHILCPGGGLNGKTWIPSQQNFFLPVRALSRVFRGKMNDALRNAYRERQLEFFGNLLPLKDNKEFEKLLARTRKSDWVVYSKKPFGGAPGALKYLSAYIHRIAISNHRLRELNSDSVTFSYRDSKQKNKKRKRLLKLPVTTFIQRYLLHLLPKNFTRIRHYGFLSNNQKAKSLELIRSLLPTQLSKSTLKQLADAITPFFPQCPMCSNGTLKLKRYFSHEATFYLSLLKLKCYPPIPHARAPAHQQP